MTLLYEKPLGVVRLIQYNLCAHIRLWRIRPQGGASRVHFVPKSLSIDANLGVACRARARTLDWLGLAHALRSWLLRSAVMSVL